MNVFAEAQQYLPKIQAIDVFCGIGGLTSGIQQAGIEVVAGLDFDSSCKYSYTENNGSEFIEADVNEYDFSNLSSRFNESSIRVVIGCAPCQPFSSHTNKKANRDKDDRWGLINRFADAIEILSPAVISMENVRGLAKTQIFSSFVKRLTELGYLIDWQIVYCPDYGIPQRRSRLVLLGSKLGEIRIPKSTHTKEDYQTVEDTIKGLPAIRAGSTSKHDKLHKTMKLSPLNLKRIIASKQGGSWKDWNSDLLPECYTKESGSSYTAVYGRMAWKDVAPTITTQFFNYGSGRFGHPTQARALSIREGSLLQTFPPNYRFDTSLSISTLGRQIGNAVPPRLGEVIGEAIKEHVYGRT